MTEHPDYSLCALVGCEKEVAGAGAFINVQRFRGGLVYKAHRLCVSPNSGLESNKEEEEVIVHSQR